MRWKEFRSHIGYLPSRDLQRVEEAFRMGGEAHKDQKRKSGELYFSHPIAVAMILADMEADADTIITALLHDTIEDTSLTLEEIDETFNGDVPSLIDGVTKLTAEEFEHKPHKDEQIETLRKIFTLMQKDVRIMVIKIADRLHNMQTSEFLPAERRHILSQETSDVYVKIADRLSMQDLRDELEALCLSTLEPDVYRELTVLRQEHEQSGTRIMDAVHKKISAFDRSASKDIELFYEHKPWPTVRNQLAAKDRSITGLSSITIAFICRDIPTCYQVLGILHQLWHRETLSFQDFINTPKINGYRGLHTTIVFDDGTRVRCKIRTRAMQDYEHRGITLRCFDSRAESVLQYLPWTERISPLSEDTEARSADFWQSLQSDILGESIIIYGADESVMVPKGATTLDGVFYVFGADGLRVTTIQVNGKDARFHDELPFGCSITAGFAKEPQVGLSWLQYVHTGTASAYIHQGLAQAPPSQKRHDGKSLLDDAVRQQGKLGLDELTQRSMELLIETLGIDSISALYESIAEGKISAKDVAHTLLSPGEPREVSKVRSWSLSLRFPFTKREDVLRAIRAVPPEKSLYARKKQMGSYRIRYSLTSDQVQKLESQLQSILEKDLWSLKPTSTVRWLWMSVVALVILWGLDPVVAHALLQSSVSAIDLTLVRFITLFCAASIMYAFQTVTSRQQLKPLSPVHPALILSSIALLLTALLSYFTLSLIPPTQYILFIIGGLVVTSIVEALLKERALPYSLFATLGSIVLSIVILAQLQPDFLLGNLLGVGSALGFALYAQMTHRYQKEANVVRARYPAFLFWLSAIALIPALFLLPFSTIFFSMPLSTLSLAVGFVLIFTALPYLLYFEAQRRIESTILDRALPFVCIATVLGESLISTSTIPLFITPLLALLLWLYVRSEREHAS